MKRAYCVRDLISNFSVKPKSIEYSKFLLHFELLFRDVKQENLCSEDLPLLKARLLDTVLSSYKSFSSNQSPFENLTASEFKDLRHLSKNKNIFIQESDKGNTIVTLDKFSYISAIKEILSDHTKFSNLDVPTGQEINYITNLERRLTSDLKLLKVEKIIDKATYKNIKPCGSRLGVFYGSGKVHRKTNNELPPSRPILPAIGMSTYKLGKVLQPFLMSLTQNECTVTDSFHFAEEISEQDPNLYMVSQDVHSLVTNIPRDETIDICIDNLYKDDKNTPKIPKDGFLNLLTLATKESFFMFYSKFFKQIDGVAMGSPFPALANIFFCRFENKWLKVCHHSLKPVFYRQCVDDIFVLSSSLNQAERFKRSFSSKHPDITFSLEKKSDGHLSF